MEKFYELFRRDLKTKRLELRVLEPTVENSIKIFKDSWNALVAKKLNAVTDK